MPDIIPDFNFPGSAGANTVLSWMLGGGMYVALAALIFAIAALATNGFGKQQIQEFAAKRIFIVTVAAIGLTSVNVIWRVTTGIPFFG